MKTLCFASLLVSFFSLADSNEYILRDGFSFEFGGLRGEAFKIDIRDSKMLVTTYYETTHLLHSWCTARVSDETLDYLAKRLKKFGSDNWDRSYVNPNILDGYHYKLTLNYKGNWLFLNGSNKQPEQFDKVIKSIKEVAFVNNCGLKT